MTKHGLHRIIIIAAMLCLFLVLILRLDLTGQADQIQASTGEKPLVSDQPGSSVKPDSGSQSEGFSSEKVTSPVSSLNCIHYTEKDFFKSVTAAAANIKAQESGDSIDALTEGPIAGGVVPHHLLAANMIADFFQTLSMEHPETIVVIAPNHRRIGLNGLHTSLLDWKTAFGMLEADRELVTGLIDELGSSENDSLMELEHSISGLVPYIKYYMPDTKIVPILLHGNYSASDSKKLGAYLATAVQENPRIMVIASIDFSHYLDAYTADRMDEITLKAIESRNTEAIIRMGNDNIDSPPSILALLSAMGDIGAEGPLVTGHSNSYEITGGGADYTTSYFTMLFRSPLKE